RPTVSYHWKITYLYPPTNTNPMKYSTLSLLIATAIFSSVGYAQRTEQQLEPVVRQIVKEANQNSQLKQLAHELLDVVGRWNTHIKGRWKNIKVGALQHGTKNLVTGAGGHVAFLIST